MQGGDRQASEEVVQLVYGELHRLASREIRHEHKGHILQTTALIHEAYLRLAGTVPLEIQNRGHFFAIASQQMRRILVDAARRSGAQKRGSGAFHLDVEGLQISARDRSANLLQLDDALSDLQRRDPRAAKVVELKYFGGYTDKEVAEVLGVAVATIRRDWEFARSWLFDQMNEHSGEGGRRKHVSGTPQSGS